MERKAHKTSKNKTKNLSVSIWEQEARGSSPRTPTTSRRKTAFLGGFSALFVLIFPFGRLLFSDGCRGRKAAGEWVRIAAETAKSLTHP